MKMLNAWTSEADDPGAALEEILAQLDLEHKLLAHSAGFITCSYDYVETGMVEALCAALPFETVGCTTLTNATEARGGTMLLCLTVLTADDCRFATGCTGPLTGVNLDAQAADAYSLAAGQLSGGPELILAFSPMLTALGGELILTALDKAADGAPIFGIVACDFDTSTYAHSFTIHNGRCWRDRMPILLMTGNVNPRFVVTATSEQNLHKQQAVITASEGSILKEVNGMTTRDFFVSLGLIHGIEGMSSVPFVVDYNDGTQPVARAIYSLNEDGSAVCGGFMPTGGTLSIGQLDVADIMLTARQSVERLLETPDLGGLILFPCLGRNMVLAADPLAEIEQIRAVVGGSLPWHLAYSGGEICPVYTAAGGTVNRFHNFTFIGCAL